VFDAHRRPDWTPNKHRLPHPPAIVVQPSGCVDPAAAQYPVLVIKTRCLWPGSPRQIRDFVRISLRKYVARLLWPLSSDNPGPVGEVLIGTFVVAPTAQHPLRGTSLIPSGHAATAPGGDVWAGLLVWPREAAHAELIAPGQLTMGRPFAWRTAGACLSASNPATPALFAG